MCNLKEKKTSSLFKTTFCCKVMFKLNLTKHNGKDVQYFLWSCTNGQKIKLNQKSVQFAYLLMKDIEEIT